MKSVYKVSVFICVVFVSIQAGAQTKKSANVTVCNIVQQANDADMISKNAPLILYIQDSITGKKFAIVFQQYFFKKMSYDPRKKLVNQQSCISGTVKTFNHEPAIFITDEKQIKMPEKAEVNKVSSNG